MLRRFRIVAVFPVSLLTVLLITQCSGGWHDPSPHSVRFVTVDKTVPLEVLDWGGSGRALVLLAGGGNTAHVFDDFAPKLTNQYHVVGITRRGFGASGFRSDDNTADSLGGDVLEVLDALKLEKPVLIGHSFAGLEMSSVANQHPERVAGLVYLDAAYSYAFNNGKGADVMDMIKLKAPQPPGPQKADLASFAAYRAYVGRLDGFAIPEAEFHFQRKARWFGRVGDYIDHPGGSMLMAVLSAGKKYTQIPVPACFIYASPHSLGQWVEKNPDPAVQADARKFEASLEALDAKQIASVREAFPADTLITIPGANHYVFMTNEAEVLQAIRSFIAGLK
ncbi:alpha/beta fold hydrolase [Occallatibacter riparius]|uniref:Alpha/beta hydrolase n=1 Tax=Occallatibacter riparius TaxID=1002689 RepID=A0A9J7BP75_9BACT|nr:alpha/beta hydrolase [Occallatibacter riparius]UWZ84329.1 alpha/beta hydrolase [Occallatibacter riparius]